MERAVVAETAAGRTEEVLHRRLVDVWRRRVVQDRSRRAQVGDVEDEVRPGERVGRQALDVGVAHDQLGERVALELRQQVHAGGAGQVVEPVAVLQVLHLLLEDVVERRAEQAAERLLLLGEAADPQVDVVDAGRGDAIRRVGVGASAVDEVEASSASDLFAAAASIEACAAARFAVVFCSAAGDGRVCAVGGDEVDQRLLVPEAEARSRPSSS